MRVFFSSVVILLLLCGCVHPSRSEVEAREVFAGVVGMEWDGNFDLVGFRDEHFGIAGEGEFSVVASASSEVIEEILNSRPPWGNEWERGVVDGEMGFHCSFIHSDSPAASMSGDTTRYLGGNEEVIQVLTGSGNYWSARPRGPESMEWHNGDLLVVEPSTGQIWYSSWDF